ncbi:uncharacterized protein LOC122069539 [Macadamia integrifolia]|uniref:uncharacterized protein LOC122069539 n=1 Tax=Macadamia integrifolia TaxID=60698 RepID=UPI001C4F8E73|nr:uncharacterized protein LOC122069539 [Macadamia integrifolia]
MMECRRRNDIIFGKAKPNPHKTLNPALEWINITSKDGIQRIANLTHKLLQANYLTHQPPGWAVGILEKREMQILITDYLLTGDHIEGCVKTIFLRAKHAQRRGWVLKEI